VSLDKSISPCRAIWRAPDHCRLRTERKLARFAYRNLGCDSKDGDEAVA